MGVVGGVVGRRDATRTSCAFWAKHKCPCQPARSRLAHLRLPSPLLPSSPPAWTLTYGGGAQTRDELDPGDGWHWKDDWKLSQTALDVYVTPERRQGMPTRLLFHFRVGTLAYDCLSSLASFSSSSFSPFMTATKMDGSMRPIASRRLNALRATRSFGVGCGSGRPSHPSRSSRAPPSRPSPLPRRTSRPLVKHASLCLCADALQLV